jgi:ornithine cyclodeaminase/alanine dehydrogenase
MQRYHPNVQFIACNSQYKEAVTDADIIVTAISGQEQILKADWIKQGTYYCHVAGLEDEFAVALKADKIECDNRNVVKHRTQKISQMYAKGLLRDENIYADLHEVISGQKRGRETNEEFVYFNSVGMSFLDVSVANWIYQKTVEAGKGMSVCMKEKSMFDY